MTRVILNSQVIEFMNITLNTKFMRNDNGKNYFFSPTISLKLFNAKVSWIDTSKKNLSFSFNKYENLTLLNMLKNINTKLTDIYNNKSDEPVVISPFFYEKDELFYIRVYLPSLKGNFHIESIFNGEKENFNIPRLNCVYNNVIIDIRNIWESNVRSGFNLELKIVETII